MKKIIIIALLALAVAPAMGQTFGYGLPASQEDQKKMDSIWRDQQRASVYIQKSANLSLVAPIVGAATIGGGYLLMEKSETPTTGAVLMVGGGIATLVMGIVANRYLKKAGDLLGRVRIEQNGISIRL